MSRLQCIDGLRGFAILAVMLRHIQMDTSLFPHPRWFDVFGLGYSGVHLFMILSGFCISLPFIGPSPRDFKIKSYFVRRATRILPTYYTSLLLMLLIPHGWSAGYWIYQVVTHVTLTHNFFPDAVVQVYGPFWSIALEAQLYLIFPVMLWMSRRHGMVRILAAAFIIELMFRIFVMRYGTGYNHLTFVLPWGLPGRVFEFALGVGIASAYRHSGKRFAHPGFQWLAPIGFLLALYSKGRLGITHPATDLCFTAAYFGLFVGGFGEFGPIARLINLRPLVWLGKISYSVYLTFEAVMVGMIALLKPWLASPNGVVLFAVPILAVSVGVSFLFYQLTEKRFEAYFKQRREEASASPT